MTQTTAMLITDSFRAKSADRVLRERILASIARAVPVNDVARAQLQSFRQNLDRVDDSAWMRLARMDRAWGGVVEKSVISHLERIAANSSHYTDVKALFAAFLSMKAL
jgi:hypothetical protein